MSSDQSDNNNEYIRAEERIYSIAINKDELDWKGFLYELIHKEGLNPWDIDLSILTKKYLDAIKEIKSVDFDISGKFLTIAVFLLKTKAENYVEHDLRGIDQKISQIENADNSFEEGFDMVEDLDYGIEELNNKKKKREKYSIKVRNPIARKRKVNIFDLIKLLEKTFDQTNKRRENFFMRKGGDGNYEGPMYEKKTKDLKEIIEELYGIISQEFKDEKAHVLFHSITPKKTGKKELLEMFIPLLHLHNQSRVLIEQENHFGEIKIHKINKEKSLQED